MVLAFGGRPRFLPTPLAELRAVAESAAPTIRRGGVTGYIRVCCCRARLRRLTSACKNVLPSDGEGNLLTKVFFEGVECVTFSINVGALRFIKGSSRSLGFLPLLPLLSRLPVIGRRGDAAVRRAG